MISCRGSTNRWITRKVSTQRRSTQRVSTRKFIVRGAWCLTTCARGLPTRLELARRWRGKEILVTFSNITYISWFLSQSSKKCLKGLWIPSCGLRSNKSRSMPKGFPWDWYFGHCFEHYQHFMLLSLGLQELPEKVARWPCRGACTRSGGRRARLGLARGSNCAPWARVLGGRAPWAYAGEGLRIVCLHEEARTPCARACCSRTWLAHMRDDFIPECTAQMPINTSPLLSIWDFWVKDGLLAKEKLKAEIGKIF